MKCFLEVCVLWLNDCLIVLLKRKGSSFITETEVRFEEGSKTNSSSKEVTKVVNIVR